MAPEKHWEFMVFWLIEWRLSLSRATGGHGFRSREK